MGPGGGVQVLRELDELERPLLRFLRRGEPEPPATAFISSRVKTLIIISWSNPVFGY